MRSRRAIFLAAASLAVGATPALADRFDPVRAAIRAQIEEKSLPSIAVAVMQDGKLLWEEGFGWANRERRIAADPNTLYSLASISKPFTATGLMTLVQAGKIDLDRPANDYLGAGKLTARVGDAREATVRRVAAHTSGLPLHYQFFYDDEAAVPPPMDTTIQVYGNLVTAPGEKYRYSNLGFGVLDHIIGRVSGKSYADFMRSEVFLPLGLTHTSVDIGPGLEPFAAMRYDKDGAPIPFYRFDHAGASAVWSSAHDLVRFAAFHLKDHLAGQKAILSDAAIDAMHAPVDPQAVRPEGGGYGIGFALQTRNGYPVVSHSGGMAGVATLMLLVPTRNIAIVVLSNSNEAEPAAISDRIAKILLPDWKPTIRERRKPPAFVPPADLVGRWKGILSTSTTQLPVELVFQPDGLIRARFGDQLPTLVSGASFDQDYFEGELNARIPNPDVLRYNYLVHLELKRRGTTLSGAAAAQPDEDNKRVRNALTHWISLSKMP